ncbi:uncharacterized protein LOC119431240 isoform X1 [Dermacentor silvarum]|nr:uncharacterized protein LOC119431240 isoform X1 [Dermacentor silvarum]
MITTKRRVLGARLAKPAARMPNQSFAPRGRGGYQPRGGLRTARGSAGFRSPPIRPAASRVGSATGFRSAGFRNSFRPRAPSVAPRAGLQAQRMTSPHTGRSSEAAYGPPINAGPAAGMGAGDADDRGASRKQVALSVSTWTVQIGEVPISYVSREKWREQCRPEKGMRPDLIDEPFRGCTLQDRHPNEPKATYTEQEMRNLCPTCGTLVIHWETHKQGKLHRERSKARESNSHTPGPTQQDVVAALRVLQATRPDIIAASLAASAPNLLVSLNNTGGNRVSPPSERMRRGARSRSPSPDRKRHATRWEPPAHYDRYDEAARAPARTSIPKGAASRAGPGPMQPMYDEPPHGPGRNYPSGSYSWR